MNEQIKAVRQELTAQNRTVLNLASYTSGRRQRDRLKQVESLLDKACKILSDLEC